MNFTLSRRWFGLVKGVADRALRAELTRARTELATGTPKGIGLPKDTGKLRSNTRRIVYQATGRAFRVYSSMFYSKYVTTAPPVWARAARRLLRRLLAYEKVVQIPVRVDGKVVKVPYRFRFRDLRPQVRTKKVHRLPNELRGSYRPVSTLRKKIESHVRVVLRQRG